MTPDAITEWIVARYATNSWPSLDLSWRAWLEMWSRISRDHVMDFIFSAATGGPMRDGSIAKVSPENREQAREFLRQHGMKLE